jgi:hypothetical protein
VLDVVLGVFASLQFVVGSLFYRLAFETVNRLFEIGFIVIIIACYWQTFQRDKQQLATSEKAIPPTQTNQLSNQQLESNQST